MQREKMVGVNLREVDSEAVLEQRIPTANYCLVGYDVIPTL